MYLQQFYILSYHLPTYYFGILSNFGSDDYCRICIILNTKKRDYHSKVFAHFTSTSQFSRPVLSDSLRPHGLPMPSIPVHHQLPELPQTHVHWVSDAIQPFHPLLPPSPFAVSLSQSQCLFQWVGSLHQVAKVLELQLWHQSFQSMFRVDFL